MQPNILCTFQTVNPRTLSWLPWVWHYITVAAFRTLHVADTCGEKLAWAFGITSPTYQYAIDEYNRSVIIKLHFRIPVIVKYARRRKSPV